MSEIQMDDKHYRPAVDQLRGMRDCETYGIAKANQGPEYDRGFAAQYQWEQIKTQLGLKGRRI